MKREALKPVLMSAVISAMLAPSSAPLRRDAIFASTFDPAAAQKALQTAVNGLETADWAPSATAYAADAAPAQVVAVDNPPRKSEPVMTEELMGRLIKYTRSLAEVGGVNSELCRVMDLCDGTKPLPLKLAESETAPDGQHYFGLSPNVTNGDILIIVKHNTVLEAYLTDRTGKLRAAAVHENGSAHLITNEKAAEKFKKELSLFAGEAGSLPPTGTSVASNG
jgi:hypothetical protein